MVFSVMLCIASLCMLVNTLKEKEVPAKRFIGLGVLFVLWGVSVLFPSFGEVPVALMRSLFRC